MESVAYCLGNFAAIPRWLLMAFILNIPMRFIEKRLFRNKSDSYRVSTLHCQLFINIAHRYYDHLADSVFYDSAIDEQFFHVE